MMLLFFASIHPLKEPFLNNMELFNELSLLTCSYLLFAFTDFCNANTRFLMGWVFVGVTVINILVNWLALFYKVGRAVRLMLRKAIYNWRLKKHLAALEAAKTPE